MFNNLGNLFKTKEQIEREERIKARRKQRQRAREQAREINQQAYEVQQIGNANAQLYQTQANVLRTQLQPRTNLLDYQRQTNNLVLNEQQEHNDFRLKRKLQDYQYINRNQHIDDVQEEYQKTKHVYFGNQPPPPQMNQFNQQSQTIPVINSPPQTPPQTKKPMHFADATTSPYMKDFGTSPFKSPPQTNKFANTATSPFPQVQQSPIQQYIQPQPVEQPIIKFVPPHKKSIEPPVQQPVEQPVIKFVNPNKKQYNFKILYDYKPTLEELYPNPDKIPVFNPNAAIRNKEIDLSNSRISIESDSDDKQKTNPINVRVDGVPVEIFYKQTGYSSSSYSFPNGSPKKKKRSSPKHRRTRQTNSQPFPIHHDSLNTAGSDSTRRRRRRRPS